MNETQQLEAISLLGAVEQSYPTVPESLIEAIKDFLERVNK